MSIHKGILETKTGNNTSDILYPKTSIDQVVGLPVPTSADSGKYLGVDSSGNFALISGTPTGYSVTIYNNTGLDNVNIYDGQDNTGTYLGIVLMGNSETFTVTSGYLYAEWDNPLTTGDVTFSESGVIVGNPATITGNTELSMTAIEPSLANTTWEMDDAIDGTPVASTTFSISFTSKNENFTTLIFDTWMSPRKRKMYYDSIESYDGIDWLSRGYKTISITGGTDVTNASLIAWLEANATQIS